ncbi:MAG: ATP synthase F1 subunit epsilon [Candidatus Daviesbacteria bacterium]|nr:ATP synthase F1 subunit epsilon [Candidatus Daviesbacteria bacterium]
MAKLNLKVVTPEKEIFSGEVDEVVVTTPDGEIGILPNHTNLMSSVVAGEMRIKNGGKTTVMVTGSGLLQVTDNNLSIMTDLAEEAADIDEKAAEEARKRAEQALEQKLTDEEYAQTIVVLEKSLARLQVKRRHRAR